MRRSRFGSETSVGLFAFLDVLMSTMGSLILVLMIISPKIRQEAVARAAAEAQRATEQRIEPEPSSSPAQPPRAIVDLNARAQLEVADLARQVREGEHSAEQTRASVEAARETLQRTQAELRQLEGRLNEVRQAQARAGEASAQVAAEGIEVESRLSGARARLRTLHGEIARASTKYTFVAYDGVSGTTRRPILIECSRQHIKFLQEGLTISATDLAGCTPSYNPLLAGCRALIDYYITHSAPGDPKPYVLLIVRPNGSVAYYAARRMLERMNDPFGYELLDDDQQLAVPPPVPEAAEACKAAIAKSLAERNDVFANAFRGRGSGGRGKDDGLFDDIVSGLERKSRRQPDNPDGPGSSAGHSEPPLKPPASESGTGHSADGPEFVGKPRNGSVRPFGQPPGSAPGLENPQLGGDAAAGAALGGAISNAPGSTANGLNSADPGETGSKGAGSLPAVQDGTDSSRSKSSPSAPGEAPQFGLPLFGDGQRNAGTPGVGSPGESPGQPGQSLPPDASGGPGSSDGVVNAIASESTGASSGGLGGADSSADPGDARGHHWGFSSPGACVGFEHDVRIHIAAAQITIDDLPAIPCGKGETSDQLARSVLAALERDAQTWGRPPQNFYWLPTIKVVITPGGNLQFERIRSSLQRHAAIASVEQRLDAARPRLPFETLSE